MTFYAKDFAGTTYNYSTAALRDAFVSQRTQIVNDMAAGTGSWSGFAPVPVSQNSLRIVSTGGDAPPPPPPPPPPPLCYENTFRAKPGNPNVSQKCVSGNWTDWESCLYGVNPDTGRCNPAPAPSPAPSPAPTPDPTPAPEPPPARGIFGSLLAFFENLISPVKQTAPKFNVSDFVGLTGNAPALGKLLSIVADPSTSRPAREALFMLSSVNPVNAAAVFGDFIFEESMQTAGMGVWQLVAQKEWKSARIAHNHAVNIFNLAVDFRNSLGKFNVTIPEAFSANLAAVSSQLDAYDKIINTNIIPDYAGPDTFIALAREIKDGDTVKFKIGAETVDVRLVGINTPEKGEPYYAAVKRFLFNRIWGENCTVKIDPAQRLDKFGRLLGTVFKDNININKLMVEKGWAFYYPYIPNLYVVASEYELAEQSAKLKKNGIWGLAMAEGANKEISLTMLKTLYEGKAASELEIKEYLANMGYSEKEINWIFFYWGYRAPAKVKAEKTGMKITSSPRDANISINGKNTYRITPETFEKPPGSYNVVLSLPGFKDEQRTVEVVEDTTTEWHAKLDSLF